MKNRNIKLFFLDISDCLEKILSYTESMTYEEFLEDERTKDAVIRNFEVMGEAAKYIPLEITGKNFQKYFLKQ